MDSKFLPLQTATEWVNIGQNNGWHNGFQCIFHENESANVYFTSTRTEWLDIPKQYAVLEQGEDQTLLAQPINPDYDGYMATKPLFAKTIIDSALAISNPPAFIDIGCGKGHVLFQARGHYSRLIGIDIEQQYLDDASLLFREAELSCQKAEEFVLPDVQAHIYIFNPFKNSILTKFLDLNIENIKRNNSLILYNNYTNADHVLLSYGLKALDNYPVRRLYGF
jgi:SAM-dependent methyltransferase